MRVCIDAGHGGSDSGALSPKGIKEADINLAVALQVERMLKIAGYQTLMTRKKDVTLSLKARSNFANRHNADLFISIHCNSASVKSAKGYEVFTLVGSRKSVRHASSWLNSMMDMFPKRRNRGLKTANFSVLRRTNMPAILLELEFMHNDSGVKFLLNNIYQLAEVIATSVTGEKDMY